MPEQEQGLMRGFQLWVNLPAKDKMGAPRYQEFSAERIPEVTPSTGVAVKVIAGRVGDVAGPVQQPATGALVPGRAPGCRRELLARPFPKVTTRCLRVRSGARRGCAVSRRGELIVLGDGDLASFEGRAASSVSFLVAGNRSASRRAVRPVRDEYPGRDHAGRAGFPGRKF
jgi:redox-sensitive bicupin YhaK (pirin superfamily)